MNTTKRQFDQVAEEYDFVNSLLNDHTFFVSNMSLGKGRALDIGCGSGLLVDKLASYYDEVVGIDISDQMCQVILGLVIIPIFQTLKNCTLFATALRLLAGSSNKVLKARTLLDDPVVKVLAN